MGNSPQTRYREHKPQSHEQQQLAKSWSGLMNEQDQSDGSCPPVDVFTATFWRSLFLRRPALKEKLGTTNKKALVQSLIAVITGADDGCSLERFAKQNLAVTDLLAVGHSLKDALGVTEFDSNLCRTWSLVYRETLNKAFPEHVLSDEEEDVQFHSGLDLDSFEDYAGSSTYESCDETDGASPTNSRFERSEARLGDVQGQAQSTARALQHHTATMQQEQTQTALDLEAMRKALQGAREQKKVLAGQLDIAHRLQQRQEQVLEETEAVNLAREREYQSTQQSINAKMALLKQQLRAEQQRQHSTTDSGAEPGSDTDSDTLKDAAAEAIARGLRQKRQRRSGQALALEGERELRVLRELAERKGAELEALSKVQTLSEQTIADLQRRVRLSHQQQQGQQRRLGAKLQALKDQLKAQSEEFAELSLQKDAELRAREAELLERSTGLEERLERLRGSTQVTLAASTAELATLKQDSELAQHLFRTTEEGLQSQLELQHLEGETVREQMKQVLAEKTTLERELEQVTSELAARTNKVAQLEEGQAALTHQLDSALAEQAALIAAQADKLAAFEIDKLKEATETSDEELQAAVQAELVELREEMTLQRENEARLVQENANLLKQRESERLEADARHKALALKAIQQAEAVELQHCKQLEALRLQVEESLAEEVAERGRVQAKCEELAAELVKARDVALAKDQAAGQADEARVAEEAAVREEREAEIAALLAHHQTEAAHAAESRLSLSRQIEDFTTRIAEQRAEIEALRAAQAHRETELRERVEAQASYAETMTGKQARLETELQTLGEAMASTVEELEAAAKARDAAEARVTNAEATHAQLIKDQEAAAASAELLRLQVSELNAKLQKHASQAEASTASSDLKATALLEAATQLQSELDRKQAEHSKLLAQKDLDADERVAMSRAKATDLQAQLQQATQRVEEQTQSLEPLKRQVDQSAVLLQQRQEALRKLHEAKDAQFASLSKQLAVRSEEATRLQSALRASSAEVGMLRGELTAKRKMLAVLEAQTASMSQAADVDRSTWDQEKLEKQREIEGLQERLTMLPTAEETERQQKVMEMMLDDLRSLANVRADQERQVSELEAAVQQSDNELQRARATVSESQTRADELKATCSMLEDKVQTLSSSVADKDAFLVANELERVAQMAGKEQELDELKDRLREVNDQLGRLTTEKEQQERTLSQQLQQREASTEQQLQELQGAKMQLAEQQELARSKHEKWAEREADLKAQLVSTKEELAVATEAQVRLAASKATAERMQAESVEKHMEAVSTVERLRLTVADLEGRLEESVKQLAVQRKEGELREQTLATQLEAASTTHAIQEAAWHVDRQTLQDELDLKTDSLAAVELRVTSLLSASSAQAVEFDRLQVSSQSTHGELAALVQLQAANQAELEALTNERSKDQQEHARRQQELEAELAEARQQVKLRVHELQAALEDLEDSSMVPTLPHEIVEADEEHCGSALAASLKLQAKRETQLEAHAEHFERTREEHSQERLRLDAQLVNVRQQLHGKVQSLQGALAAKQKELGEGETRELELGSELASLKAQLESASGQLLDAQQTLQDRQQEWQTTQAEQQANVLSLQAALSLIRQERDDQRAQLATKQEELGALRQARQRDQEELLALTTKSAAKQAQVTELQAKLARQMTDHAARIEKTEQEAEAQLSSVRAELAVRQEKLASSTLAHTNELVSKQALEQKLAQLARSLCDKDAFLAEKEAERVQQLSQKQNELVELQGQLCKASGELSRVLTDKREQDQALSSVLQQLEMSSAGQESVVRDLQRQVKQFQSKRDTQLQLLRKQLELGNSELSAKDLVWQADRQALQAEVDNKVESLAELEQQLTALLEEVTNKDQELDRMQDEHQGELAALLEAQLQRQEELELLTQESEGRYQEHVEREAELETELADVRGLLSLKVRELEATAEERTSQELALRTKLAGLEAQLTHDSEQLQVAQDQLEVREREWAAAEAAKEQRIVLLQSGAASLRECEQAEQHRREQELHALIEERAAERAAWLVEREALQTQIVAKTQSVEAVEEKFALLLSDLEDRDEELELAWEQREEEVAELLRVQTQRETEFAVLTEMHEQAELEHGATEESLRRELEQVRAELQQRVAGLQASLQDMHAEARSRSTQEFETEQGLRARLAEVETRLLVESQLLQEAQDRLETRELEWRTEHTQHEETVTALEGDLSQVQQELARKATELELLKTEHQETQERLAELTTQAQTSERQLLETIESLQKQLEAKGLEHHELLAQRDLTAETQLVSARVQIAGLEERLEQVTQVSEERRVELEEQTRRCDEVTAQLESLEEELSRVRQAKEAQFATLSGEVAVKSEEVLELKTAVRVNREELAATQAELASQAAALARKDAEREVLVLENQRQVNEMATRLARKTAFLRPLGKRLELLSESARQQEAELREAKLKLSQQDGKVGELSRAVQLEAEKRAEARAAVAAQQLRHELEMRRMRDKLKQAADNVPAWRTSLKSAHESIFLLREQLGFMVASHRDEVQLQQRLGAPDAGRANLGPPPPLTFPAAPSSKFEGVGHYVVGERPSV